MKPPSPRVHLDLYRRARLAAATSALLLCGITSAQSQVADFTPQTIGRSGNPTATVTAGGLAFFVALDQFGQELWRTDGSTQGTIRLADLAPGATSSDPEALTAVGNLLYFTANVSGYGRELFVSDGTVAGTHLVLDIDPTPGVGSDPASLCAHQGRIYFRADDGVHGAELWVSDGTAAGTQMVVDQFPGGSPGDATGMVSWNNLLWFVGQDGRGREVYSSDGTAAGTQLLVDLVPGSGSASPGDLVAAGARLYFTATENGFGKELYVTDGTSTGTQRVLDIYPGAIGSFPRYLTAMGNLLVFEAGDTMHGTEPWRSDGTAAGTFLLGDLVAGTASSQALSFTAAGPGLLYFCAQGPNGRTLWRTDGSSAGTNAVQPNVYNLDHLTVANGAAVFAAQTANTGAQLWVSNGTGAGTQPVPGSPPPQFTRPFAAGVLFTAYVGSVGRELFFCDGVTTSLVRDIGVDYESSPLDNLTALGSSLFFSPTFSTGWLPWITDGTANGTLMLSQGLGNPMQPVSWRNEVWFTASTPATSFELCHSNGGSGGTAVAFDLVAGTGTPTIRDLLPTTARLFFTAAIGNGRELWSTDGTLAGCHELDLRAGTASGAPQGMIAFGDRCVFSADDGVIGREPWISDGSSSGTFPLADLTPGGAGSSPASFARLGDRVFFAATLPGVGRELCSSDGTSAGTGLFADLLSGASSSSPHNLVGCGNLLFFTAEQQGTKLFVSDGTVAGTGVVRDISPSIANVQIQDMVGTDGRLFFFADDRQHGRELWTSDGTFAGTTLVADLMPGTGDSVVVGTLIRVPGTQTVVFAAGEPQHGLQLWQSDGTAAGTVRVGAMGTVPGSGATRISLPTVVDGRIYFYGGIGDGAGDELWFAPLQQQGLAFTQSYGGSLCPGTNGMQPRITAAGAPRLGNASFAIGLHQARSNSAAVLALGFAPADTLLGTCHVLVAQPLTATPLVATDNLGTAHTPLPMPSDPAFVGLRLCGQYLVFDPQGALFGAFTLTDGLQLVIGT